MKQIVMICFVLSIGLTAALADTPVSEPDAQKIRAALQPWGCSGGKMEQETEGSGFYEVDDAKCPGGQYDIKLDKEFKVLSIVRD